MLGLEPGRLVLTASHTEFAPSNPSELDLRDGYSEGPVVLELLPLAGLPYRQLQDLGSMEGSRVPILAGAPVRIRVRRE